MSTESLLDPLQGHEEVLNRRLAIQRVRMFLIFGCKPEYLEKTDIYMGENANATQAKSPVYSLFEAMKEH